MYVREEPRFGRLRTLWRCLRGIHHWHETTTELDHCCNCPAKRRR